MYNFKRLISKYSKEPVYKLEQGEGYNDWNNGGVWVEGEIEETLIPNGAVLPLSKDELEYDEGGTYNQEDRKMYCYEEVEKGTKIKHKNKTYTIQESLSYGDFDIDLNIYFIKRGGRN